MRFLTRIAVSVFAWPLAILASVTPCLASPTGDFLPTSEQSPITWRYVTQRPVGQWADAGFDDSQWKSGPAPFGKGYDGVNTPWTDTPGDIWMRCAVTAPPAVPLKLLALIKHDDDAEVYINGVLAAIAPGYCQEYDVVSVRPEACAAIAPGKPVLVAVHCHQGTLGQVIDIGLCELREPKSAAGLWSSSSSEVTWKSSTASALWRDEAPLAASARAANVESDIAVDPTVNYQRFDSWGGCVNERGWSAMSALAPPDRDAIMHALFDPVTGLKLTVCRSPIGASDYAISPYSLDETPGDYGMANFSIDRDMEQLIPFLKAAASIRPDLKVWAVPWSPPGWMKTNNSMLNAGDVKSDPQTMNALALYFEKYVLAYRVLGINVTMVMPQNEPTQFGAYPSCFFSGRQLQEFIGKYLGPTFKRDRVNVEICLGTLTNSRWDHVAPTLSDPVALSYIKGIGFQWLGAPAASKVHSDHPELMLMQTETICGNHENNWAYAEDQFRLIQSYFEAGVNSYMLWNMVLDQTGANWSPIGKSWNQCSPVVVDQATKQMTYTPQYYGFKHFSYYVQPGAHRVAVAGRWGDRIAFRNPDGTLVLIVQNSAKVPFRVTIALGDKQIQPLLAPHSWNTFTISGGTHQ